MRGRNGRRHVTTRRLAVIHAEHQERVPNGHVLGVLTDALAGCVYVTTGCEWTTIDMVVVTWWHSGGGGYYGGGRHVVVVVFNVVVMMWWWLLW